MQYRYPFARPSFQCQGILQTPPTDSVLHTKHPSTAITNFAHKMIFDYEDRQASVLRLGCEATCIAEKLQSATFGHWSTTKHVQHCASDNGAECFLPGLGWHRASTRLFHFKPVSGICSAVTDLHPVSWVLLGVNIPYTQEKCSLDTGLRAHPFPGCSSDVSISDRGTLSLLSMHGCLLSSVASWTLNALISPCAKPALIEETRAGHSGFWNSISWSVTRH